MLAQFKALEKEDTKEEKEEEEAVGTSETTMFRNVVALLHFLANVLFNSGSRDPCTLTVIEMNAICILIQVRILQEYT
jgi:hypothetical protein